MKLMVMVAHPNLETSRANAALVKELQRREAADIRLLYREYPDWKIDVEREQRLLLAYDRIVFQFPWYWYSCPALLKKWMEDVLTFGWAYGPEGKALKGKEFMAAITSGGTFNCYQAGGENWFTISEFLKPIQRTFTKCNGVFLPPYVLYNANRASEEELLEQSRRYAEHILSPAPLLVH
ncbi:NAD(P)H-dependent oxidoreductase [Cohnella caldifontis]|uniref:NAD(P)H-dependent oxidoreductase n=1 Tax=Cohnella caldifontis TaxID=3027471 RepID=UPI0023ED0C87|nr:NAD(P)H-dependent oxidoreductase [Cohnella sp. YIM B05605]